MLTLLLENFIMKKIISLSLLSTLTAALATTPGQPGMLPNPSQSFPVQDPFAGMDLNQLFQNGDLQEMMQQLQQQFGQLGRLGQQLGQQNWQTPFRPQGPMTYLGAKLGPVSAELAHHMDLPRGFYQTVTGIEEGSPADKAGLKEFDIITHLDDQEIINAQQLVTLVRGKNEGDTITIKILRKGKKQELTATLAQHEGGDALPPWNDPNMDINQLMQNLQKQLGQLQPQPQQPNRPAKPAKPGKPRIELIPKDAPQVEQHFQSSRSMSIHNDEGQFQYKENNGDKHLKVIDPQGNVMFDGPVNTEEERKSIPEAYRATLKQLEGDGKGNFKFQQKFNAPRAQPKPQPKLQKKPQAL
ncbi:MAG: hypothetical protein ACI97B_001583 [Verrucomicrobiales bacterium]|jgi:hypothetical protein